MLHPYVMFTGHVMFNGDWQPRNTGGSGLNRGTSARSKSLSPWAELQQRAVAHVMNHKG